MTTNDRVTLKRRHFKDTPNWKLIDEEVPLGTEYIVLDLGVFTISNREFGVRQIPTVHVTRENDCGSGWMPLEVFED